MTIKETVKQALIAVAGNHPINFWANELLVECDGKLVTMDQIKRALRDLPHVRRVNGHYIVKGRKVPAPQPEPSTDTLQPVEIPS